MPILGCEKEDIHGVQFMQSSVTPSLHPDYLARLPYIAVILMWFVITDQELVHD